MVVENELTTAERTTLRDWGNGLTILGAILLVVYSALALLSVTVCVEGSWRVWTYPRTIGLSMTAILILLVAGLILRAVGSQPGYSAVAEEAISAMDEGLHLGGRPFPREELHDR